MQTRSVPISEVRAKRSLHAMCHVLVGTREAIREHLSRADEMIASAKAIGVTLRRPTPKEIAADLGISHGHVLIILKEPT